MSKRYRVLLLGAVAFGAALAFLLMMYQFFGTDSVHELINEVFGFLREHLIVLFIAIVVLPGIGFPMTPLYLVAGPAYGSSMGVVMSCVIILCASTLNMIWTYFVAAGVLHKYVEKVLNYLNYGFPEVKGQEHVQMILIMRVTPGIPLVVQNYLL